MLEWQALQQRRGTPELGLYCSHGAMVRSSGEGLRRYPCKVRDIRTHASDAGMLLCRMHRGTAGLVAKVGKGAQTPTPPPFCMTTSRMEVQATSV